MLIPQYPEFAELTLDQRPELHAQFQKLPEGISEFTFANLYLFREEHRYRVSRLPEDQVLLAGKDGEIPFFMLPFGLPESALLDGLFRDFGSMKCVSASLAEQLEHRGYKIREDRDNLY